MHQLGQISVDIIDLMDKCNLLNDWLRDEVLGDIQNILMSSLQESQCAISNKIRCIG